MNAKKSKRKIVTKLPLAQLTDLQVRNHAMQRFLNELAEKKKEIPK